MMKNKFKIIITILLFIFSFYYTDKCVNILKNKDPLMQEIIKNSKNYNISPIDAVITNNTVIPGTSGLNINLNKSYEKMKKLGNYDESLLVYEEVLPNISYKNYYDKIIVSNNQNNKISLVFNIKDLKIYNEITNILDKYNVKGNYFFQNSFFSNNVSKIKEIEDNILVNNLFNLSNYENIVDYCLVKEISNKTPCQNNNKYTLLSNINIDNYHLTYTKNNYINSNIITYTFNEKNINDLDLVINYLINNNVKIVSIDELIKE